MCNLDMAYLVHVHVVMRHDLYIILTALNQSPDQFTLTIK